MKKNSSNANSKKKVGVPLLDTGRILIGDTKLPKRNPTSARGALLKGKLTGRANPTQDRSPIGEPQKKLATQKTPATAKNLSNKPIQASDDFMNVLTEMEQEINERRKELLSKIITAKKS